MEKFEQFNVPAELDYRHLDDSKRGRFRGHTLSGTELLCDHEYGPCDTPNRHESILAPPRPAKSKMVPPSSVI